MNGDRVSAYLGLGSNLADPPAQLRRALAALARLPDSRLQAVSGLYRSPPMGPPDQPDYVNAVARLDTRLSPLALLDRLQAIERAQGRVRGIHWGPRTLDLDLLLHGRARMRTERLVLPHPGLHERPFVLVPLAEIAPRLVLPGGAVVAELAAACSPDAAVRFAPAPELGMLSV